MTTGFIVVHAPSSGGNFQDPSELIAFDAIFLASQILKTDRKCAKFFGLTNKNGRISQTKLKNFLSSISFDLKPQGRGAVAYTNGNNITLNGGFFIDGWFRGTPAPFTLKDPRQGRTQTVLHELAHAKGLLIAPDNYGFANDPEAPANKNDKTILDNCGDSLSKIRPL